MACKRPTKSYKVGEIVPQSPAPGRKDSPFHFEKRLPGWHPDADVVTLAEKKGNKDIHLDSPKALFLDEALFQNKFTHRFGPFPVPGQKTGAQIPFAEPPSNGSAADWHNFNKWILGGPIPKAPADVTREPALTTLLRQLAVLVRRYNASLYRLRRLHFFVYNKQTGDPPDHVPQLPPRNKFGDPELPPKKGKTIDNLIHGAETDWIDVTTAIEKFICNSAGPHQYLKVGPEGREGLITLTIKAADMVEVNGYIVSMRVVANEEPGPFHPHETGGISSSHISISSAFSSS